MAVIEADGVSYRYGSVVALDGVSLAVPAGALYALLGPNGSGKTTLLQILSGQRRPDAGRASVLDRDVTRLRAEDRTAVTFVAEGQPLPGWMRLEQLESYLAPLYPGWDGALAAELRRRFRLDPRRKVGSLSRGEHMKAALLCALAPRPRVVLMDEPFTGMDVLVKDEIVGGLLEFAGSEGWTVILASHDIAELELLVDWVGLLDDGRLLLSEPVDTVRARFRRVELVLGDDAAVQPDPGWLRVRQAGRRVTFLASSGDDAVLEAAVRAQCPGLVRLEVAPPSLRDLFVGVTDGGPTPDRWGAPAGSTAVSGAVGEDR